MKLSWSQLTKLEPRLTALLKRARAIKDDGNNSYFCANEIWYRPGGLKDQLCQLVGWDRKDNPVLETSEAYDVAYKKIYEALPDCRDCLCF